MNEKFIVKRETHKTKQYFEFSSKADTLEFFYKRIKKSKIEKLIVVSV